MNGSRSRSAAVRFKPSTGTASAQRCCGSEVAEKMGCGAGTAAAAAAVWAAAPATASKRIAHMAPGPLIVRAEHNAQGENSSDAAACRAQGASKKNRTRKTLPGWRHEVQTTTKGCFRPEATQLGHAARLQGCWHRLEAPLPAARHSEFALQRPSSRHPAPGEAHSQEHYYGTIFNPNLCPGPPRGSIQQPALTGCLASKGGC